MPADFLRKYGTWRNWRDAGTTSPTPDENITLGGLASDAGVVGDEYEFDSGASRTWLYQFELQTQWQTTPVVGQTLEVWAALHDGTTRPAGFDGTDVALGNVDLLRELTFVGVIEIGEASTARGFVGSWEVESAGHAFVQPVLYNASDDQLSTTDADHLLRVRMVTYEDQA